MSNEDTGIGAYVSLGADINKPNKDGGMETKEGVVSQKLPELNLDMKDEDLIALTKKWKKAWEDSPKKAEWLKKAEENEKYWLGQQFTGPIDKDSERPMVDNAIFESLETFLPSATRRNPEPIVELDSKEIEPNQPADQTKIAYATKVKQRLADVADKIKLRLKLKRATRYWSLHLIGIAKFGWDLDKNLPSVKITRAKRIILDPDASIDEDGYNGSYIGEYKKMQASKILAIAEPKPVEGQPQVPETEGVKKIKELVKENTGTEINYIEWWTPEYTCWEIDEKIILKKKNPHWNYDEELQTEVVDEFGKTSIVPEIKKGINHLPVPMMPYAFLTMFNLGDQPMDKTSLIGQNLANQDAINKRNKQINKNVDGMNEGMVVSLARSGLTDIQAKNITSALRKGGVVTIPDGSPDDAVKRMSPNNLPSDVFNELNDKRVRLRDIFGTSGITPAGTTDEKTVRGKIINRGLDTDRVGGGISEYLEQFADDIYNWVAQLLYVYDDGFQFVNGAVPPKVVISVKEGSLLPKDSTTISNQALELAGMGRLSNIDLFKRLEYPNPEELAANIWLEANAPELLYKDNPLVAQAIQMRQMAMQAEQELKMKEMETKHEQGLEKEVVKGEVKANQGRSMLSEVDQNNA